MSDQLEKSSVEYHDTRFFLVFIPLVNALNYYLTYTDIKFNAHTGLTFAIDTLQGFGAWWIMRIIILYLDKRLPYQPDPLKRITVQIIATSLAGLGFIIFTTEILNSALRDKPVPKSFYLFDIFIFLIWFFVINGIYIGLHYFNLWQNAEKLRILERTNNQQKKTRQEGLLVRQGKQNLIIPVAELAAVYVEGEYAMLLTTSFKKHLHDLSLEKIEKQLPEELFFRINRQVILHRQFIAGFERSENGKLSVLVSNAEILPSPVLVSRTKAAAFKNWFRQPE
jgi:hypothetical protein